MARNYMEEKKAGFFQWFIVIVVPLLFAITIALIILTVMGIDVVGKTKSIANQIPFVSSAVTTDDEKLIQGKIEQLQGELDAKQWENEQLSSEVYEKEQTIEALNQEITKLNEQLIEVKETAQSDEELLSDVSGSFIDLDPEVSAPIFENMEDELAITLLKNLPSQQRGAILGEMDPQVAAELTNLLLAQTK
ncbi:MotE family protein [Aquibacillus albus]|uniref:Flagellar motility protein MotE (MotC chaperone) n=1 Tax=Aquibacillus albus TaxID=1168171 RepID=A0ABS2N187_9BACI|nr:hypothetical protein [Aquibacillus albus]MBM7571823.1 flagellar motility protein MotE (MotC chaperone) [Aquibacillus albus]